MPRIRTVGARLWCRRASATVAPSHRCRGGDRRAAQSRVGCAVGISRQCRAAGGPPRSFRIRQAPGRATTRNDRGEPAPAPGPRAVRVASGPARRRWFFGCRAPIAVGAGGCSCRRSVSAVTATGVSGPGLRVAARPPNDIVTYYSAPYAARRAADVGNGHHVVHPTCSSSSLMAANSALGTGASPLVHRRSWSGSNAWKPAPSNGSAASVRCNDGPCQTMIRRSATPGHRGSRDSPGSAGTPDRETILRSSGARRQRKQTNAVAALPGVHARSIDQQARAGVVGHRNRWGRSGAIQQAPPDGVDNPAADRHRCVGRLGRQGDGGDCFVASAPRNDRLGR